MAYILIAEDEKPIAELIRHTLQGGGHTVETASDGETACNLIESKLFDLALLDIMLPLVDGYELLEYTQEFNIPVLFVTAKRRIAERVHGLQLGADDYITKPFDVEELLARVNAALRRQGKAQEKLSYKNIDINLLSLTVVNKGKPVELTPKEFELLVYLVRNKGVALYRGAIYERVWGEDPEQLARTLDLHIQRLRKKLNFSNEITTVFKVGYKLENDR